MQEHKHENIDKEIGRISIAIYQNSETNKQYYKIITNNENVEQLAYVIEDTLYDF